MVTKVAKNKFIFFITAGENHMSWLDNLKSGFTTGLYVKNLQNGSSSLINKHTNLDIFNIKPNLMDQANEFIKEQYMFGLKFGGKEDFMNEYDAAMMKLISLYELARCSGEDHMVALIADSITKMRIAGEGEISATVSRTVFEAIGL